MLSLLENYDHVCIAQSFCHTIDLFQLIANFEQVEKQTSLICSLI